MNESNINYIEIINRAIGRSIRSENSTYTNVEYDEDNVDSVINTYYKKNKLTINYLPV